MNHEPQTWADLQDAGNAQTQLLLQAVARHADWDTGECWPRVSTLCRMAKCSESTCRRHLKKLRDDGLILIRQQLTKAGDHNVNMITLVGYAEWIAANRSGGKVRKPKTVSPRYSDSSIDDGGSGQSDHTPPGSEAVIDGEGCSQSDRGSSQIDQTPLQNDSTSSHSADQTSSHLVTGQGTLSKPNTNKKPPNPQGGKGGIDGFAKGWDDSAVDALAEVRTSATAAHVATVFVDAVRGTMSPASGPDGGSYVRQLSKRLRDFDTDVLAELAELEHRNHSKSRGRLRPAADLELLAQGIVRRKTSPALAASGDVPSELAGKWAQALNALIAILGDVKTNLLFGLVTPVRLLPNCLVIAAAPFIARDITDKYSAELTAVCRSVFGVSNFEIETPKLRNIA